MQKYGPWCWKFRVKSSITIINGLGEHEQVWGGGERNPTWLRETGHKIMSIIRTHTHTRLCPYMGRFILQAWHASPLDYSHLCPAFLFHWSFCGHLEIVQIEAICKIFFFCFGRKHRGTPFMQLNQTLKLQQNPAVPGGKRWKKKKAFQRAFKFKLQHMCDSESICLEKT